MACPQRDGAPLFAVFVKSPWMRDEKQKPTSGHLMLVAADGVIVRVYTGNNYVSDQETLADINGNGVVGKALKLDGYTAAVVRPAAAAPKLAGAFTVEAFDVIRDLQLAVRGSREELEAKPLTVFSCCPTSPLKWTREGAGNLVDCAREGVPVEIVPVPLSGFMAPVTLTGTLVQHTAETLSGVVISQLAGPGAPVLYGGAPAIFDMRYETTPMGAVETMMIDCAYNEIGKFLGLPTQAYIGLSDAKALDAAIKAENYEEAARLRDEALSLSETLQQKRRTWEEQVRDEVVEVTEDDIAEATPAAAAGIVAEKVIEKIIVKETRGNRQTLPDRRRLAHRARDAARCARAGGRGL